MSEPGRKEGSAQASTDFEARLAAGLRGFGPLGILSFLVILGGNSVFVPLTAILVVIWTWLSRTPWREIGYSRPKNWAVTVVVGIVFGIAFKLLMKVIVMPLLGADPINWAYHFLVGNTAAVPAMIYIVIVGAGFGEETFFRGYLFERLGKLFGSRGWAKTMIVLLTSIAFALAHYSSQGVSGMEQACITGLVFGTIFAITGHIWLLMFAHASFDLTAITIIYWDLESYFAHLIFK